MQNPVGVGKRKTKRGLRKFNTKTQLRRSNEKRMEHPGTLGNLKFFNLGAIPATPEVDCDAPIPFPLLIRDAEPMSPPLFRLVTPAVLLRCRGHDQRRHGCLADHAFSHAAEQQRGDDTVAVRTQHHEIRSTFLHMVQQGMKRTSLDELGSRGRAVPVSPWLAARRACRRPGASPHPDRHAGRETRRE